MILFNNYSDTRLNYIFISSLLPFRDQKITINLKKIQSELFSYYYSVVIELLVAASKLMRRFSDKNDSWQ